MVHYYASILLIAFVLASCFYRKHVRDWHLFRAGVYLLAGAMVLGNINGLVAPPFSAGGAGVAGLFLGLIGSLAELAGFVVLVLACARGAEEDQPLHCPRCRYILKGLSEPRCPECGFQI